MGPEGTAGGTNVTLTSSPPLHCPSVQAACPDARKLIEVVAPTIDRTSTRSENGQKGGGSFRRRRGKKRSLLMPKQVADSRRRQQQKQQQAGGG